MNFFRLLWDGATIEETFVYGQAVYIIKDGYGQEADRRFWFEVTWLDRTIFRIWKRFH